VPLLPGGALPLDVGVLGPAVHVPDALQCERSIDESDEELVEKLLEWPSALGPALAHVPHVFLVSEACAVFNGFCSLFDSESEGFVEDRNPHACGGPRHRKTSDIESADESLHDTQGAIVKSP
jgi:hypothetical protein